MEMIADASENVFENVNVSGEKTLQAHTEPDWIFYLIQNRQYTYAGVSPDPVKRLRKHNGEICGGAKYTKSRGDGWTHVCLISGFETKIQCLQFEWAVKHAPAKLPQTILLDNNNNNNNNNNNCTKALRIRLMQLFNTICKPKWTSKSPFAKTVTLTIEWCIKMPSDVLYLFETQTPSYILFAPHI